MRGQGSLCHRVTIARSRQGRSGNAWRVACVRRVAVCLRSPNLVLQSRRVLAKGCGCL